VVASLAVPVLFPAVAALGNKLYVFGGVAQAGAVAGHPVDTIQVVDLKTLKVTDTGHLPQPLSGAAAIVLGHDIFLAGGDSTGVSGATAGSTTTVSPTTGPSAPTTSAVSAVSTVWSYDPASGTSTTVGRLFVAVSHAGVAVLGSTAWLVGGESDGTPVSAVQNLVVAPS
jgi:N-acetylneuraminic acid mutarotase